MKIILLTTVLLLGYNSLSDKDKLEHTCKAQMRVSFEKCMLDLTK